MAFAPFKILIFCTKAAPPLPEGSAAGIYSLRSGGAYTGVAGDAKHRAARPSKLCLREGLGQRPIKNKKLPSAKGREYNSPVVPPNFPCGISYATRLFDAVTGVPG